MPKFAYKARKNPRELIESTVIADNRNAAIFRITGEGLYIISIDDADSVSSQGRSPSVKRKVSIKDIAAFMRQLSDLIESGLTVVSALEILHEQTQSNRLKEVISDIKNACIEGSPLSEAFGRHPSVFSPLCIGMVRSGERGGALDNVLRRLSDFLEARLELQTKIRSALAYPVFMSLVGIATITVLLTFVIPKMADMFRDMGQALPLPTLILVRLSSLITKWYLGIIIFIGFAIIGVRGFLRSKEGRAMLDKIKLSLPVIGDVIKKIEIARFAKTLATLLKNGVPILESLDIVGQTVPNAVIKEDIERAFVLVKDGARLASSLPKNGNFPAMVINMIRVGEESGQVEHALLKVADSYERESDAAIKIAISLLEPALIVIMGAVVGFIVISMLLPIIEINFLVR